MLALLLKGYLIAESQKKYDLQYFEILFHYCVWQLCGPCNKGVNKLLRISGIRTKIKQAQAGVAQQNG